MRDATSRLDGFQAVEQNEAPLGIKEKRFLRSILPDSIILGFLVSRF